ncbi:cation transporter [Clostridia bacterium]|nr:cation transporter [Clostridia bacterium]
MKIFDFTTGAEPETVTNPEDTLFISCRPKDIIELQKSFDFDHSTVIECTNLDESVRYAVFDNYDFISLVHPELLPKTVLLREINIYVSKKYLVFVIPQHDDPRLTYLEALLEKTARAAGNGKIIKLYKIIFQQILFDFSEILELLEDNMEALTTEITESALPSQFEKINILRKQSYTLKKQLRAMSHIGEQMLADDSSAFPKQRKAFKMIDSRFKSLYGFAENLYSLGNELVLVYDSKLTMRTNEIVTRLTVFTMFFGPLTVITGIYGMNFDMMPELHWVHGYPMALAIMATVSLAMYTLVKKNKWI